MLEDPNLPPPSDTNSTPTSEPPNRPEPAAEVQVAATESANNQPEQSLEAPAPPVSESAGTQPGEAVPALEPPQAP